MKQDAGNKTQQLRFVLEKVPGQGLYASSISNIHTFLGSVFPSRGIGQVIVVPWTSKEAIILHLIQISEVTGIDRHAVMIMDGAGWHADGIADQFTNVSIIKLPSYSPELN